MCEQFESKLKRVEKREDGEEWAYNASSSLSSDGEPERHQAKDYHQKVHQSRALSFSHLCFQSQTEWEKILKSEQRGRPCLPAWVQVEKEKVLYAQSKAQWEPPTSFLSSCVESSETLFFFPSKSVNFRPTPIFLGASSRVSK